MMLARTVMAATKLDIFESLAAGPLTAEGVAERCDTHPRATEKLLNALVGIGCLRVLGERYNLPRSARSWLLKDGKTSVHDQNLLRYLEWRWWEHCEEFVRTGRPLRVHKTMTEEEWGIYERGMRSGIEMNAHWVARHLPLSPAAQEMLDIGGSHGYFSVAICRRYPGFGLPSSNCLSRSSTLHRCWPKRAWEIASSIGRAMRLLRILGARLTTSCSCLPSSTTLTRRRIAN